VDASILAAAEAALGIRNLSLFVSGGQKVVGTADSAKGRVIVKIIELLPPNAAIALERARREVAVLEAIDHPNVVRVESGLHELGSPTAAVCWLEEQLDGVDLNGLPGGRGDWDTVAKMASDVLAGLTAFHQNSVVHRDLSPRNIRRLSSGDHKVMDPGIARLILETTITGAFDPGTPGYMSPEHVSPVTRPSYASDVFAVGVLMYEGLAGQSPVPFVGDFPDYARRLRESQAPSVGLIRTDLTAQQIEFVDTCLQRQLARRFLDAQEALEALGGL
jgi:serine/threonine-protein kinase